MERLARLEVERAVLHLHEDVVAEAAVERRELQVGALDAIGIDLVVVDEGAPHHDAAVRRDGVGQHVGAVGVRALVVLRPRLAFAVGLDDEAAEVGNARVDLVGLRAPPGAPPRGRADRPWRDAVSVRGAAKLADEVDADAVGPQRRGDRRDLGEVAARSARRGLALTLLITVPLMPSEALARA